MSCKGREAKDKFEGVYFNLSLIEQAKIVVEKNWNHIFTQQLSWTKTRSL